MHQYVLGMKRLPKSVFCLLALVLASCQSPTPIVEEVDTPMPEVRVTTPSPTATDTPTATVLPSPTPTREPPPTATESLSVDARIATRRAAEGQIVATEAVTNVTERGDSPPPATTAAGDAPPAAATLIFLPTLVSPPVEPAPMIPLTDMGQATYYGYEGGLYPGGANQMPQAHVEEGLQRALQVQPLNTDGQPDPDGRYVLLSIGLSNTAMEFCTALGLHQDYNSRTCTSYSFMGQSAADPAVNQSELTILSGARGGQVGDQWVSPDHLNYDRIRDELLLTRGLSEAQVQVVWVKVVDRLSGEPPLPSPGAHAFVMTRTFGEIMRTLKTRYPNLQQVFVSSRIYAGYADEVGADRNPEPYAYESGFAVKWLIEAQIRQMETGEIDALAGDLNYNTVAPWVAWGPYLWADGLNPRSDGLVWPRNDFADDGVHPAVSGRTKVATMLLNFFKASPYTRCWFVAGGVCG